MAAMVEIVFNDDSTKAEIPSSALFFKDGQCCIWVYDPGDGRVNRRAVTVDRLDAEGHAIVSAGISAGEQIVVTGVHKLSDNQRVSPLANASATNVGGLL